MRDDSPSAGAAMSVTPRIRVDVFSDYL